MASLTIQIPDALATRVLDAMAARYGYQEFQNDGTPNPVSKKDFVVRALKDHLRGVVVAHETAVAAAQAQEAANAKALKEVVLP